MKESSKAMDAYHTLKTARLYTWLTVAIAASISFFYVVHANLAVSWYCMLALPLIILLELWFFKGMIGLSRPGKNDSPSLSLPLILPGGLLILFSLAIYNVYEYYKVLLYALPLVILSGFAAHKIATRGKKLNYTDVMFAIITALSLYCCGAITFINCYYDGSTPKPTLQPVIKKYISTGRTKSYYIVTPDWDVYGETRSINIMQATYANINIGDTITIWLKPGNLGIKWYYLSKNDK